jgi:hypothetical protein
MTQGIVIQGPTNYYKKIVENFKDIPNVVWSTWDSEPKENISYIKNYFPVIQNPLPEFNGYLNVNYQVHSTFSGVEYLAKKGVTEVLKTRGDITISNIKLLLEKLKGQQLSFIQMCKPGVRTEISYHLEYFHDSHDYPADVIMYGDTELMLNGYNFNIPEFYPIPPESLIAYSLLENMGIKFELNYQHLINNGITFFLQDCLDNDIDIFWLKHNHSIVQNTKDKKYYEY